MRSHPIDSNARATHQSILVVEDERTSRRALSSLLRAAGYEIRAVASGEDALKVLTDEGGIFPAVALVDFNLPGMDGLELISQLQKMDSDVFTVLITANDGAAARLQLQARPIDYLRKPINFEQLLQLVERHLPNS